MLHASVILIDLYLDSSVSSGINSMSAVTLEDIIKPIYHRTKKRELSEYYCRALTRTLGKGREWAFVRVTGFPHGREILVNLENNKLIFQALEMSLNLTKSGNVLENILPPV